MQVQQHCVNNQMLAAVGHKKSTESMIGNCDLAVVLALKVKTLSNCLSKYSMHFYFYFSSIFQVKNRERLSNSFNSKSTQLLDTTSPTCNFKS